MHIESTQICPAAQAVPQPPQFSRSVRVFAQKRAGAPPSVVAGAMQVARSDAQLSAQAPLEQT